MISSLPAEARCLLGALQFNALEVPACSDEQWRRVLTFADRTQLTLQLPEDERMPAWLRDEISHRRQNNMQRQSLLRAAYLEIAAALAERGLEFVLLKGITHADDSHLQPYNRVQYDLDLLCPYEPQQCWDTIAALGYEPHGNIDLSDQHLRPLVRPFTWKWRGDYYDPDMPVAVEVHADPYNGEADRIEFSDGPNLWMRRNFIESHWGASLPALRAVDRLGFAGLHAFRHIIRNDVKLAHAYELAAMLEFRRNDDAFWTEWTALHSPAFRRIQAIAFRFASIWFGAQIPPRVQQEVDAFSREVHQWFTECAYSPVANLFTANKDVIWLHAALLDSSADKLFVARSRLLPTVAPARQQAIEVESKPERLTYARHVAQRLGYHTRALIASLLTGARLWRRSKTSSKTPQTSERYRSS